MENFEMNISNPWVGKTKMKISNPSVEKK